MPFTPGQRWISDTESELGLGMVEQVAHRRVTLLFPAANEQRTYALGNTPLTRARFAPGDKIESREGWVMTVGNVVEAAGLLLYEGSDEQGLPTRLPEQMLSDFTQFNRPQARLLAGLLDDNHWFDLRLQTLLHRQRLEQSPLLGLSGARTQLLPHQLYIAREVGRRTNPRLLLADEVGLGKTIEAGLILHQQLLTGRASRILIIVPAPLLYQWLIELRRRFNLNFSIFDQARCEASGDPGSNPFLEEQQILCSLEFLTKNPERQQQLLEGEWDTLVVDEAHHLEWHPEQPSPQYQLIESLAHKIPGVLLLTATPEQLGREAHFARLRLLDPDRFHDLQAFRNEAELYAPIAEAVGHLLREGELPRETAAPLLDSLGESACLPLLRQLESDNKVTRHTAREQLINMLLDRHGTGRAMFRNTRTQIQGFPARQPRFHPLPLPGEYQARLQEDEITLTQRLQPESISREIEGQPWWRQDPRVDWLIELLKSQRGEKILLICNQAETAQDIELALRTREGIHIALFHEGMSLLERDRAAAWFADPEEGCPLLACSEIGSEGRNFQFAHQLVLFDLPLDPDLLEQRIGRLDRIGQTQTIQIHLPYFEQSSQAVLLRWYQEGLDAFCHTCPAGHGLLSQLRPALLQAIEEESSEPEALEGLIEGTRRLHAQATKALQRGRDHLLEINSCRQPDADKITEQLAQQDKDQQLPIYLEQLCGAYGINHEPHSRESIVLHPSTEMTLDRFPQLPDEGLTGTFERATALSHEDWHFLSWEHPLIREGMGLVIDSDIGNSSVCGLKHPGVKSGQILLELLFLLECPAPRALQARRFLPPTLIRLVLNQGLKELSKPLSPEVLEQHKVPLDKKTAKRVIQPLRSHIEKILIAGEAMMEKQQPTLITAARQSLSEFYDQEIDRLTALQQLNPNVQPEEIQQLRDQAQALDLHLEATRLKLDSIRLLVSL